MPAPKTPLVPSSSSPSSIPRHVPTGTSVNNAALSSASLARLLHPTHRPLRARLLALLSEDVFRPRYGESLSSERRRTMARIARLRQENVFVGTILPGRGTSDGGIKAANQRYELAMSCMALLDHSLEIKLGVSLGLFGSSVRGLGTEEQARRWLPKIERLEEFGCFALTELGHGSNARGIETTATYDTARGIFVLHTPRDSAQKYWIGGAAETATLTVAFAQLSVNGEHVGVHAFVVRMRDRPGGNTAPGIRVADCGAKNGLNGVDNGRIWFDHVAVPRDHLLGRTCGVSADGEYSSRYGTPDARFGAALAALTGGRVGIGANSILAACTGVAIAVKYTSSRRAFSPAPGEAEVPLLTYSSIQRRLMVPLATCYVYSLCSDDLRGMWSDCLESGNVSKEMHVLSSGFKAMFTWFMAGALQDARESCGGQGYKSENRIGLMRADRDISLTFEGANDVLMQQVAKECLTEFGRSGKLLAAFSRRVPDGLDDASQIGPDTAVTDAAFIYHVLQDHERKLTAALATQMARLVQGEHLRPFDAWSACLPTAGEVAKAHMQRRMFEMHHLDHVPRAAGAGEEVEAAMKLCGELHFLNAMDTDGSFLRMECITPSHARAVHVAVQGLCMKMADVADKLVDGFEIPPYMLAPIAFDFMAHNARARL